jgi:hypothetical protein
VIKINGIEFKPQSNIALNKKDFNPLEHEAIYHFDYYMVAENVATDSWPFECYRDVILEDLWFIVYFVMGIQSANHPFVVKACQEVKLGPRTKTLDIWARYHFKSSIITIAETVQYHLKNPDECTCIFSYKKPAAEDFVDAIRNVYQTEFMIALFPDVLYANPTAQSPSWSLQNGITLKRKNTTRKEATVEASGLIEGMVTGKHFQRRIYDDVETEDMANSPDVMDDCFKKFDMSDNLGTGQDDDIERIVGTYYSHLGPLVRIRDLTRPDGKKLYSLRLKPTTHDGTRDGRPVLVSKEKLEELKTKIHFNTQHLCDPTPPSERKLKAEYFKEIDPEHIPASLYKFMVIDYAGDSKNNSGGDSWAIHVVGVEPCSDALGAMNIYITDSFIDSMSQGPIVEQMVRMYLAGGWIQRVGYERPVADITPAVADHFMRALAAQGRRVSEENGSFVWLRHGGRAKDIRISSALEWPLNNGKIHISKAIPVVYRHRLKQEADMFPNGKKDGLDALAYLYDLISDYRFPKKGDNFNKNWRKKVKQGSWRVG